MKKSKSPNALSYLNRILMWILAALLCFLIIQNVPVLSSPIFEAAALLLSFLIFLFPGPGDLSKHPLLQTKELSGILLVLLTLVLLRAGSSFSRVQAAEWTTNLQDNAEINQYSTLHVEHPDGIPGDIWVILRQQNTKYYPETMSLDTKTCSVVLPPRGGTHFDIPIRVGEDQDYNQPFTLLVVVADRDSSQFLINTLKQWCQANNYPGLPELPSGVTIEQEIHVRRTPSQ